MKPASSHFFFGVISVPDCHFDTMAYRDCLSLFFLMGKETDDKEECYKSKYRPYTYLDVVAKFIYCCIELFGGYHRA